MPAFEKPGVMLGVAGVGLSGLSWCVSRCRVQMVHCIGFSRRHPFSGKSVRYLPSAICHATRSTTTNRIAHHRQGLLIVLLTQAYHTTLSRTTLTMPSIHTHHMAPSRRFGDKNIGKKSRGREYGCRNRPLCVSGGRVSFLNMS